MEPEQGKKSDKASSSRYAKRPMWQWVLIYVLVAAVAYGLVYLVFVRDGSGNNGYGY